MSRLLSLTAAVRFAPAPAPAAPRCRPLAPSPGGLLVVSGPPLSAPARVARALRDGLEGAWLGELPDVGLPGAADAALSVLGRPGLAVLVGHCPTEVERARLAEAARRRGARFLLVETTGLHPEGLAELVIDAAGDRRRLDRDLAAARAGDGYRPVSAAERLRLPAVRVDSRGSRRSITTPVLRRWREVAAAAE